MFQQGVIPGTAIPSVVKSLEVARVSGILSCAVPGSVKKIFFWHGRVTETRSSLIDDRMGEVIYRMGKLSLDQFLHAAGKVSSKIRFGEALIASGVFSPIDLWDALNSQAREILSSLCFYESIEISFEENTTPPKNELIVQFELDDVLNESLVEAGFLDLFLALAMASPRLVLEENHAELATSDFLRDMVGLVQGSEDFLQVVEKGSRLSPVYTIRALYELYKRGIIKDTFGFARGQVREGTVRMLGELVEDINFMFVELSSAAKSENIADWDAIVASARRALTRELGSGMFIHPEHGFVFENVLRACVCLPALRERMSFRGEEMRWLDLVFEKIHDILYGSILMIFFELYNRKINSSEFARAKATIDRMKYPNVD
jgi:hypothetical protein